MWMIYHTTRCGNCGADLTERNSIDVEFIASNGAPLEHSSEVLEDGSLNDPYKYVAAGWHSCSTCHGCGELLDELEPEEVETVAEVSLPR